MSNRVGFALFLLVVALGLSMVVWWRLDKIPVPACGEVVAGRDCILLPPKLDMGVKVKQIVALIRDDNNRGRFAKYDFLTVNQIQYTSVKVVSQEGTYSIHVFPNSVTYWFKKRGAEENTLTWADHEFDGQVDFGVSGDISDRSSRNFDGDLKMGLQYHKFYQHHYNKHMEVIAYQLGL